MLRKCFIFGLGISGLVPLVRAESVASSSVVSSSIASSRVVSSTVHADSRTGRLVRKTVVSQTPDTTPIAAAIESQKLNDLIDSIALKNEVEAPLVHSVIQTESNYNPLAVSNKGAQGLMQLIPATARRFGVKDSFDMQENVEGGTKYLKYLIDLFHGDYSRAVAAYNAGEAAVTKFGGIPPYKETQNYVARVAKHLQARRQVVVANAVVQSPAPPAAENVSAETYNPVIASVSSDGRVYYRTP